MELKGRILIVDSSGSFEAEVKPLFAMMGVDAVRASDCKVAIRMFKEQPTELLVLLINEGSHKESYIAFRKLRRSVNCAILVGVSGHNEFVHRVHSRLFANGADIVMANPTRTELGLQAIAAIRMVHKHWSEGSRISEKTIVAQDIEIMVSRRRVYIKKQKVILPPKEFDILVYLAQNPRAVKSYADIYTEVWKEPYEYVSREVVWSHIHRLRFMLRVTEDTPNYIKNSKGYGYSFEPDPDDID